MNVHCEIPGQKEFIMDKPTWRAFPFKKLLFGGYVCTIGAYFASETAFPLSIASLTICTVIFFLTNGRT